jgi:molybdopterin converting factor small subunit
MSLAADRAPDQAANQPVEAGAPASVVLLFFAEARVAAGTGREALRGRTVGEVLGQARSWHGDRFGTILDACRVWVNGEPATPEQVLQDGDEVAVLPPVSGGTS